LADGLSLAHRVWRVLPARTRRAGLVGVAKALAPRADAKPPARSHGVVVAGELEQNTGVGEAARVLHAACGTIGVARGAVCLGVGAKPEEWAPADAALLLAVNAPSIPLMLARADKAMLRGRRVMGAWAWELPVVPRNWDIGARYVHEVWACSPFTAAALERLMPGKIRVVPHPLAMLPRPEVSAGREEFGLPENSVVTVMVFGLGSSFTRKNPLGGIAAFKRAFGGRDDQMLVVKFSGAEAYPKEALEIAAAAGGNVKVFSGNWAQARMEALLACADIVLSLHRSEGFGLVPAQAMLRGIPVVATGWSGNMAFMDEHSAALVGYRLVKVADSSGVYEKMKGAEWAEPDMSHAAELLRRLGDDAAWRAALGARGKAFAEQALNGDELRAGLVANGIDGF
jgi:glycosyltransferase involved in cell wall biosynthesis